MPFLRTFPVLLASVSLLCACGHIHHETVNDSDEKVTMAPPSPDGLQAISGQLQPVPQFPVPNKHDVIVMTNKLAGGNIEIYDVREAPLVPQLAAQASAPIGLASVMEPNVTVFPLSNGGRYPGQYPLTTQTAGWPNAVLPGPTGALMPSYAPLSHAGATKVYFKHGSSRLSPRDRSAINAAAEQAKFAPVSRIHVDGHASKRAQTNDPVRNSVLNLKESMNRAFEVSKEMMMQGVPSEKIKTTAWGDSQQMPSMDEDQARRVDVYPGVGY